MSLYRHYKGGLYKVLHEVAEHSETLESLVVYKSLTAPNRIWVRPFDMFHGYTSKGTRRFERIEPLYTLPEVEEDEI